MNIFYLALSVSQCFLWIILTTLKWRDLHRETWTQQTMPLIPFIKLIYSKKKQEEGFIRTAGRTCVGYFLFAGRRFQLQSCWLTCERVRVCTKATLHFLGFHNAEHRLDGRLKNKVCPSHFSNEKHPKCLQWRMLLTSKLSPLLRASICSDLGQDSAGSVKQAKVLLRMIKF